MASSVAMSNLQSNDYYENLGIAHSASQQEIKTACVNIQQGPCDCAVCVDMTLI